jgi:hypothetical protein
MTSHASAQRSAKHSNYSEMFLIPTREDVKGRKNLSLNGGLFGLI